MPVEWTDATRRLLLSRIRQVMIGVGLVAGLLVAGTWLIDEGEVVKLTTWDDSGREYVTELWIVDLPSGSYLRAGSGEARWLARLRDQPETVLERDDRKQRFRALPQDDPELSARVNRAMREKYGLADRIWEALSDRRDAVTVRLEPLPADGS